MTETDDAAALASYSGAAVAPASAPGAAAAQASASGAAAAAWLLALHAQFQIVLSGPRNIQDSANLVTERNHLSAESIAGR